MEAEFQKILSFVTTMEEDVQTYLGNVAESRAEAWVQTSIVPNVQLQQEEGNGGPLATVAHWRERGESTRRIHHGYSADEPCLCRFFV